MPHFAKAERRRKLAREMATEAPRGVEQNPAYRPQNQTHFPLDSRRLVWVFDRLSISLCYGQYQIRHQGRP